eukprot:556292-Heterocapsa_arctica.AAC.1
MAAVAGQTFWKTSRLERRPSEDDAGLVGQACDVGCLAVFLVRVTNKRPFSWTAFSSQTQRLWRFEGSLSSFSTQRALRNSGALA